MRILITNDDGINAPGLMVLHEIATRLAGQDGEVWTVAPAFEQSGVGHCISYTRPMMVAQMGPRRFAAEGSPADCVLAGLHDVMKDSPPDLVLSGVNRGNNSAENTLYSGTIGGAMEAALQGLPAIALSQYYGPRNNAIENPFEASAQHGVDVVQRILAHTPQETGGYRLFYNVNFPPVPGDEVLGIRLATQGFREGLGFSTEPHNAPSGRRFLWIKGGDQHRPTAPGSDAQLNLEGYISVTPMRADLTAHDMMAPLAGINT
ncbi:5'-nucleotidase SurE [Roseobacter denitrificans]|uniref:5'-nucleotidase SurE n=1 Tax=Roseobacter denitrificans (strain ATCC 33942 / OCh 114) TaxID=375451 RepID=SURE_ROSDO|nr:5'/3'-nucleotidase SurE [Roseobacter denitrificans]Q163U3.1 RecName: Full=5'-nucleotidase SurE; AltName: Full=Nucleoside 5'-monophosphate phosphohydrolase [Roseobacter denitrificans OCh 114]ABG32750.1 acid phosphatase SurE, putative [Roseobacter denitrificans OCh 114]AVL54795.1 5'-nucleotidase SurE [Roseobacter denitrificans]SFF94525.1 5'-nucleotidase /3'-nucleotidase /exopolyphosphatase [Roseobacter denitrificans OCh 114]